MNTIAKNIVKKLNKAGYEAYIVGGFVRDTLMNRFSTDIDITTSAPIEVVMHLFKMKSTYYAVHFKKGKYTITITTYRKEIEYQKRKPIKLSYTNDLKTDLLRRDFTINTICMDQKGHFIDLLGGINDLKLKTIKMVGDASIKLKEDPLRILRAIRLYATLDFKIEKTLEEEMIKNKEGLKELSGYRILEEMNKILTSSNYQKGLTYLKENHFIEKLGLSYTEIKNTSLIGKWAQMQIEKNLPFTKEEKENIVKVQKVLEEKRITPMIVFLYGKEVALLAGEILNVSKTEIENMEKNLPIHSKKELKLSYLEICSLLSLKPSKEVQKLEEEILEQVVNQKIKNTKKELTKYVLQYKEVM